MQEYTDCPPLCAHAKMNFITKFTFCSLVNSLTLFQQNANLRIFTTFTMGRLNEAKRHRSVGMVEGGLSSVK